MTNLLTETIDTLRENGKKPKDVLWVGTNKISIPWDTFSVLADREYDDGYGSAEVNSNLVIVGSDWWLKREEYDGSEWWSFNQHPSIVNENPQIASARMFRNDPSILGDLLWE